MRKELNYYKGKKVLVTGCTGFKGTWMCQMLLHLGANVFGYALEPNTIPNIFALSEINKHINTWIGDIRDYTTLQKQIHDIKPDIIFHLAAQPLVLYGYQHPKETFETNVMGTVNLLECIRHEESVRSVVNITTDKVYENQEWCWGYRETDRLNGYDPYSNSKSCSELVTDCYKKSYFIAQKIAISTVRAGNVIGGGDFSKNRIIPDCIYSAIKKETIEVRNPSSIRPYQHVLEPLSAYLYLGSRQIENPDIANSYNIGPDEKDCITTGELVEMFCKHWSEDITWKTKLEINAPHEANYLRLDCTKAKQNLMWYPKWNIEKAVEKTIEWTKWWKQGLSIENIMEQQIREYWEKKNG